VVKLAEKNAKVQWTRLGKKLVQKLNAEKQQTVSSHNFGFIERTGQKKTM
jgi:hypothetical protein